MKYLAIILSLLLTTNCYAFTPDQYSDRKSEGATTVEKRQGSNYRVKLKQYNRHTGSRLPDIAIDYDLNNLIAERDRLQDELNAYNALISDAQGAQQQGGGGGGGDPEAPEGGGGDPPIILPL